MPSGYRMPKYTVPLSFVGTCVGFGVLLKEYMGGKKFEGKEKAIGKTIVITGANSGIGKETAIELARRGGRIVMGCRDMEACKRARAEIVLETANRNLRCQHLDLASLDSVREFADYIYKNEPRVDVLINNAGVMHCPKSVTQDGFETQLGVNHLGHFCLTLLLLDKLKASAPSRIINISSLAHIRGTINFDDLNSTKHYDRAAAYEQSKLANVLFTRELAQRLQGTGVTVNSLHPGVVKTELGRHMSINQSYLSGFFLAPLTWLLMKTPRQGAQTSIYCALASELEDVTGKYFSDCKEKEVAPQAQDDAAAKRLWAISEKWCRLT